MKTIEQEFEELLESFQTKNVVVEVVQAGCNYKIKLIQGSKVNYTDRLYLNMTDAVNAAYSIQHNLKRG